MDVFQGGSGGGSVHAVQDGRTMVPVRVLQKTKGIDAVGSMMFKFFLFIYLFLAWKEDLSKTEVK